MYFDIFQIVRDSKDRVFTWGFGGYGRLGHQQPKDEHVPRLVSFFKGKSESKRVVFLYCLLLLLLSIFFFTTGIKVFVLNTLSEIRDLSQLSRIIANRSDEGLMLETSAFKLFTVANLHFKLSS